jgi:hypothetical protein
VLVAGGIALWTSRPVPPPGAEVPPAWCGTVAGTDASAALRTEVRSGAADEGDLLRLEWPAHPHAREYRVRFVDEDGAETSPVTVQGNVLLYDLRADALALPPRFRWDVTAVLQDGSEALTPPGEFPGR